jgi:hypothetical protein
MEMVAAGLEKEWAAHRKGDFGPVADEVRRRASDKRTAGAMLSFPSPVVFNPQQLTQMKLVGIATLALVGPERLCLEAFLQREKESGRGFDEQRWHSDNDGALREYAKEHYTGLKLEAFKPDDTRWSRNEMVAMVKERFGLVQPSGPVGSGG